MKKLLSIILTVLMLSSILSMFAIPTAAEDAPAETGKVLKMYVSDTGDDANDGFTTDKPMKTITKAVNYMKNNVAPGKEYTSAELILVGTVTTGNLTIPAHPNFHLTITSANKSDYILKMDNTVKLGGETLFTNIKIILVTKGKYIWCNGRKNVVFGKPGVANDVITYDAAAGSVEPLTITGTSSNTPDSVSKAIDTIDITINSGTFKNINLIDGTYGAWVKGDVNLTINDATIIGGVISIGGIYKTGAGVAGICMVEGNTNVTINGGNFTDSKISVGYAKALNATKSYTFFPGHAEELKLSGPNSDCAKNIFLGDVNININGGTFTGTGIIAKGGTLDTETADVNANLVFKKGVNVDLVGIKNADKAAYKALVSSVDGFNIVEHALVKFEDVNDTQHKASCPCGCGKNEMQNHAYDAGEVTKQPSHSAAGEKTYTCADCKGTKVETISPDTTTHNYTTGWVKVDDTNHKKTCDDPACPDANKGLVTEAHTWDEGKVTKEATHTEEGEKTFTCSVCNGTKTEAIKKTEIHSMGDWEKHDANQHKRVCECGEAKYADHNWDAGTVTKAATADAEGEKTFKCSVCQETKTEAIAKLAPAAEEKSGCGSTVGFGMAAIAVACAAAFVGKKKED